MYTFELGLLLDRAGVVHMGQAANFSRLVPICTRVHFSRFDPKVPHFSRKFPRVTKSKKNVKSKHTTARQK